MLKKMGLNVLGCFEEEYNELEPIIVSGNYLKTSLGSDRFLQRFDHKTRIEILGKEVKFWRNILNKIKPDIVVNETVAIEIAEVLAIEAEKKGIKILTNLPGFLPDTFYWKPNPFTGEVEDISKINTTEENLKLADKYIRSVKFEDYKPIYVQYTATLFMKPFKSIPKAIYYDLKKYCLKTKLKRSKSFKYEDDYSYYPFKNSKRIISRCIFKYTKLEEIKSKNIVFYPLHYEPEATLNYFSEEYQNQTHTIESIARAAKHNQIIVVKEHPLQPGELTTKEYRNLKRKYSNIYFIPAEINTKEIIRMSEIIVTLTSTAAWEGLILGKPIIVLGKIFYNQCPGTNVVQNYKQLKDKLREENYMKPNENLIREFAAKMINIFEKASIISIIIGEERENTEKFKKALIKKILEN